MKRVGEVTAVYEDQLEITFCRPADCGKCHACMGGGRQTVIRVAGKAEVGDAALVEMPAQTVRQASLIAYIIPLAGMLLGAFLGSLTGSGDVPTAIGALLGLALTLGIVLLGERKRRSDAKWIPTLIEVWPKEEAPDHLKEE